MRVRAKVPDQLNNTKENQAITRRLPALCRHWRAQAAGSSWSAQPVRAVHLYIRVRVGRRERSWELAQRQGGTTPELGRYRRARRASGCSSVYKAILCFLCTAAVSAALAADSSRLVLLRTARSVTAEAAATIDLEQRGLLSQTFVRGELDDASDELRSLADDALKSQPDLARSIDEAARALAAKDVALLRAIATRLHTLEQGDVAAP
jgi:hypothetical protein